MERKRRIKKTEERGRRLKKTFRWKPSKKIDEENTALSHRQLQVTFRTPLATADQQRRDIDPSSQRRSTRT